MRDGIELLDAGSAPRFARFTFPAYMSKLSLVSSESAGPVIAAGAWRDGKPVGLPDAREKLTTC